MEYYSATNNPRWEYYTAKIHETLKSPRIKDFLDAETKTEENSTDNKQNFENNKEENHEDNLNHNQETVKILQKNEETSPETITENSKSKSIDDPLHKNESQGQKIEIIADENIPIDYSDDEEDEEDS